MVKLKVNGDYKGRYLNQAIEYHEGDEIEVDDVMGRYLQNDSPGTFSVVKPKTTRTRTKSVKRPPVDRAMTGDKVVDK